MAAPKAAAVLLGLAAFTTASPMVTYKPTGARIFRRQEEVDSALCTNAQLSKPEGAAGVWNDHGVGTYLDEYLKSGGEDGWLDRLAGEVFPGSGDQGSFGCGFREQACLETLPKCEAMVTDNRGPEFWIFNAVQKLQDAMERAHTKLQDEVQKSALSVSSIASDFKVTITTDDKILRYVAAAFGIAGGLVGYGTGPLVNGLKTTATMFGGAFAASANTAPVTIDPSKAIDSTLRDIFTAEIALLDGILKTAVGGGGDYAALPDQAGDYGSSVAKFFADGRFILVGELVSDYFATGFGLLDKKLVDVALKTYGYSVLKDENFLDEASCTANYGARWMDLAGEGRCMRLVYQDGSNNVYWPASESVIKSAEKYKIDITEYYNSACDCAINGSGEPDTESIPADGSLPQCFYNIACQSAEVCQELNDDWSICWPQDWNEVPQNQPEEPAPEEPAPAPEEQPEPAEQGNTGCYSGGLPWSNLHGDDATSTDEVIADIDTTCQKADGAVIKFGESWWHCSEWSKTDGGVNHIWWEIQHDYDGTDDRTVGYESCKSAWGTEVGGCSTGSEQYHDAIWWKIDPQEGACPFKDA